MGRRVFIPAKTRGFVLADEYDHPLRHYPRFHGPPLPPHWGAHPFFPGSCIYADAKRFWRLSTRADGGEKFRERAAT